jgi:hypothetical protein
MANIAEDFGYPGGVQSLTFTVATTAVTGGNVVSLNGDRTVAPAAENDTDVIGVAMHDAAVGERVAVITFAQVVTLTAGAGESLTAGDHVAADGTAGAIKTIAAAGDGSGFGIALEDISTAGTGLVMLMRV